MVTNEMVWLLGERITNYPCDVNKDGEAESNGGIEHIIEYQGRRYAIVTGWDEKLYRPDDEATEIFPDEDEE